MKRVPSLATPMIQYSRASFTSGFFSYVWPSPNT